MKTRKLNKKGLTARELVLLILAIGVLVLMFWGPLGSWWSNLSKKFNIFEKSVDDRLKDLDLTSGLSKADKEDIGYIIERGDLEQIKEVLRKSEDFLKDRCADDSTFVSTINEIEEKSSGNIRSGTQEFQELLKFKQSVCDRTYECTKENNLENKVLDNFIYFIQRCTNDQRISELVGSIKPIIKNKYSKDAGEFCNQVSKLPIANNLNDICLIKNVEASCPLTLRYHVVIDINLLSDLDRVTITLRDKNYLVKCSNKVCKFDQIPEAIVKSPKTYDYKIKATFNERDDTRDGSVVCSLNQKP